MCTNNFVGCSEGWLVCSSCTIMVDKLGAEGVVETGI
jgi:hypothetical protein